MGLPWTPVAGWSLVIPTAVSTKSEGKKQMLRYSRSRNMVRTHASTGESHWSCSSLRLLVDRRSVDIPVQMRMVETSRYDILGYVPYQMWVDANPGVTMLLQNSMRSFRHELLIPNFKGIPIMQQHGSEDNNVPVFHSRRMHELISRTNGDSPHQYVELKGKNHWFDGVMTTIPLLEFYDILGREADWAKLPQDFTIIVANPADMGARGGLLVDQLISPDQLGRIEVERCPTSAAWVLRTSNVLRFHFVCTRRSDILPHMLVVDQSSLVLPPEKEKFACWLIRSKEGSWHVRHVSLKHPTRKLTLSLRCPMIVNGSWSNVTARNWGRLTRFFVVLGHF